MEGKEAENHSGNELGSQAVGQKSRTAVSLASASMAQSWLCFYLLQPTSLLCFLSLVLQSS